MPMLDDPVWNSLLGAHQKWSQGVGAVRRYESRIAPFVGIKGSAETLKDYVELGEEIVLVSDADPGPGFVCINTGRVHQMVFAGEGFAKPENKEIVPLAQEEEAAMVSLTDLAFPGYFRAETWRLGAYFGVYAQGQLVAMAGERMQLGDYREVSAICTHPDFRHRGLARRLTERVMHHILEEGLIPFLHVGEGNAAAIALYESLGFRWRSTLPVLRYRRLS